MSVRDRKNHVENPRSASTKWAIGCAPRLTLENPLPDRGGIAVQNLFAFKIFKSLGRQFHGGASPTSIVIDSSPPGGNSGYRNPELDIVHRLGLQYCC